MRRLVGFLAASLVLAGLSAVPRPSDNALAQDDLSPLTINQDGSRIHLFPTVDIAGMLAPTLSPSGPLVYNGGPVMLSPTTYAIFWLPATGLLQSGAATGMSAQYRPLLKRFLIDYPGHSIANNNTQYYENSGINYYINNAGKFGGAYVDTSSYPVSGCVDSATPGNCLTDLQIQHEVRKVMSLKGWTAGLSHLFLVFTSSGEGSCADALHCAYTYYCAYHNASFNSAGRPILYTNQPYADLTRCQTNGTPSPNGDPWADAETSIASHELTESITDPELSGWFTATGYEIGDLCAYDYGAVTWDSGAANEMWNGNPYLLQQEYDNHAGGCAQVGP